MGRAEMRGGCGGIVLTFHDQTAPCKDEADLCAAWGEADCHRERHRYAYAYSAAVDRGDDGFPAGVDRHRYAPTAEEEERS
jgi:hypothetical protein